MNNHIPHTQNTITIDELILDGFGDIDVSRLQAGISAELSKLSMTNAASQRTFPMPINANRLSLQASPKLSSHQLGQQVAQAAYAQRNSK